MDICTLLTNEELSNELVSFEIGRAQHLLSVENQHRDLYEVDKLLKSLKAINFYKNTLTKYEANNQLLETMFFENKHRDFIHSWRIGLETLNTDNKDLILIALEDSEKSTLRKIWEWITEQITRLLKAIKEFFGFGDKSKKLEKYKKRISAVMQNFSNLDANSKQNVAAKIGGYKAILLDENGLKRNKSILEKCFKLLDSLNKAAVGEGISSDDLVKEVVTNKLSKEDSEPVISRDKSPAEYTVKDLDLNSPVHKLALEIVEMCDTFAKKCGDTLKRFDNLKDELKDSPKGLNNVAHLVKQVTGLSKIVTKIGIEADKIIENFKRLCSRVEIAIKDIKNK